MATPSIDEEFNKYWGMLTQLQKESLLNIVKSFINSDDNAGPISIEQYIKN